MGRKPTKDRVGWMFDILGSWVYVIRVVICLGDELAWFSMCWRMGSVMIRREVFQRYKHGDVVQPKIDDTTTNMGA